MSITILTGNDNLSHLLRKGALAYCEINDFDNVVNKIKENFGDDTYSLIRGDLIVERHQIKINDGGASSVKGIFILNDFRIFSDNLKELFDNENEFQKFVNDVNFDIVPIRAS